MVAAARRLRHRRSAATLVDVVLRTTPIRDRDRRRQRQRRRRDARRPAARAAPGPDRARSSRRSERRRPDAPDRHRLPRPADRRRDEPVQITGPQLVQIVRDERVAGAAAGRRCPVEEVAALNMIRHGARLGRADRRHRRRRGPAARPRRPPAQGRRRVRHRRCSASSPASPPSSSASSCPCTLLPELSDNIWLAGDPGRRRARAALRRRGRRRARSLSAARR